MNMHEQDLRDAGQSGMQYAKITETIIGCAFEVINELGAGFLESVYEKALSIALQEKGLTVQRHHPICVYFRNRSVGDFFADLFVEGKVIVELKAVKAITPEHQAQTINYLKATGIDVGLLINLVIPNWNSSGLVARSSRLRCRPARRPCHPTHPC